MLNHLYSRLFFLIPTSNLTHSHLVLSSHGRTCSMLPHLRDFSTCFVVTSSETSSDTGCWLKTVLFPNSSLHVGEQLILARDPSVQSLLLVDHFWTANSKPVLGKGRSQNIENSRKNKIFNEHPVYKMSVSFSIKLSGKAKQPLAWRLYFRLYVRWTSIVVTSTWNYKSSAVQ